MKPKNFPEAVKISPGRSIAYGLLYLNQLAHEEQKRRLNLREQNQKEGKKDK